MIVEFENTLRRLIIELIGAEDDSDYKISPDRIKKWIEKRNEESKRNKGVMFENRILYYSDFYDIKTIVYKNWDIFLPILHDKKRFDVFFKELEGYRNTLAHGRNLIYTQKLLLEGIVSDLKNLITIYHNKNEMKDDFFVKIIKVNDNLGNIWNPKLLGSKPTLRVGDQYELIVEANDPKDREIEYKILDIRGFQIVQKSNHFVFKVENDLVGENVNLIIEASTPNSEYPNRSLFGIDIRVFPSK